MRERDATMVEQQDDLALWLSRSELTVLEVECLLGGVSPSQYARLSDLVNGRAGYSARGGQPSGSMIEQFELLDAKVQPARRLVAEAWSTGALPFNQKEPTAELTVAMRHLLRWVHDEKVVSDFFRRVGERRTRRTYKSPVGDELKKRLALWRMKPSYSAFEIAALMSGNEPDTFADILEVMEYDPTDMIFFHPVFAGAEGEVKRAIASGILPIESEGFPSVISGEHVVRWLKSKGVADGFFVTEGAIHERIQELEAANADLSSQLVLKAEQLGTGIFPEQRDCSQAAHDALKLCNFSDAEQLWRLRESYPLETAAILLAGYEPKRLYFHVFGPPRNSGGLTARIGDPFASSFPDIVLARDSLTNAFAAGVITMTSTNNVDAQTIRQWAKEHNVRGFYYSGALDQASLHSTTVAMLAVSREAFAALERKYEGLEAENTDTQQKLSQLVLENQRLAKAAAESPTSQFKSARTNAENSLLKIVSALCNDAGGLELGSTSDVSEIVQLCEANGHALDTGTVKKWRDEMLAKFPPKVYRPRSS